MQAGAFDRPITIEQKTVTRDAIGGEVITWTTYASCWAHYRAVRDAEGVQSDQVTAQRIIEFTIRTLDAPLVNESMRIQYEGVNEIIGLARIGRDNIIKLKTRLIY